MGLQPSDDPVGFLIELERRIEELTSRNPQLKSLVTPLIMNDAMLSHLKPRLMADGSAWDLFQRTQPELVRRIINRADPEQVAAAANQIDEQNRTSLTATADSLRQAGLSRLHPGLVVLLILAWLLAVGVPAAETELPSRDEGVVTNEIATLGLALAITWRILDKRSK